MSALVVSTVGVKDKDGNAVVAGTCTDGTRQLPMVGVLGADGAHFQPSMDDPARPGYVASAPAASGGLSVYRNLSLVATGVSVKGSAGQLYGYYLFNASASVRFVKLYDKASAPTVGSDTPVLTIPLPAGSGAHLGPGSANGIAFSLGIGIAATQLLADADTTAPAANDVVVNLFYK